ncbi:ABC transporter substrate-binding protein [Aureimonas sp. SK2]|uniref:ABC transporter substrate-binding protein n=1 Tax=Aureimonas sp. SK2 TaxID=3015992 RepID=UPI002443BF22|nr:ABC transporter substrate-binding protein [Aureimonas sp. SK2]
MKAVIAGLVVALSASAAHAADVRILWYSDGVEGEVMKDLLSRFHEQNPDINVTLDNVAFQVVREQLPIQLEAGQGPDIARVTELKPLSRHWLDLTPYLKNVEGFEAAYGDQLDWMRPDNSDIIPGFMTQITLSSGFANKTLFDRAGVALPGEGATWDQWMEAARTVAASQQVPIPAAIDRSGHRISGPNLSFGANYIAVDGSPAPVDAGVRAFTEKFVGWNRDGTINPEVWVTAAGTTYRAAAEDFVNGQVAFYYSGSWQIPNFSRQIGDAFDWVATGSPCGPSACTGIPGGAGLVAVKYTKEPEAVARVMEYLASEPVAREFAARSLFLPANKAVRDSGVEYRTEDPQVAAALEKLLAAQKTTSDEAQRLPGWRWSSAYYGALVNRVSQVIAGELSFDQAYARIDVDVRDAVAAAQ